MSPLSSLLPAGAITLLILTCFTPLYSQDTKPEEKQPTPAASEQDTTGTGIETKAETEATSNSAKTRKEPGNANQEEIQDSSPLQAVEEDPAANIDAGPDDINLDDLPKDGEGIILGEALDFRSGAPITAAQVKLPQLNRSTATDGDGRFRFDKLPLGTYQVQIYSPGYQTLKEDAIVDNADAARQVFTLLAVGEEANDIYAMDTIDFLEEYEEAESQTLLDIELTKESNLKSGLGKEEFSKSGVSDAGDAVSKIAGANIVGGRYAVVRGLGDRYSNTLVNGAQISSADPSKKAVQLDLFPTNLLESVEIYKSNSPDLPAEWAGGLVSLDTLRFPSERIFEVSIGTGWNENLSDAEMRVDPGRDLDFFGNANYQLPSSLRSIAEGMPEGYTSTRPLSRARQADRDKAAEAASAMEDLHLSAAMRPGQREANPNTSLALTYGDVFELTEDLSLGAVFAFTRSTQDQIVQDVEVGNFYNPGPDPALPQAVPGPFLERTAIEDRFTSSNTWGMLGSIGLKIGTRHEIGLTYFKNSDSQQQIQIADQQRRRDGDNLIFLPSNRTPDGAGAFLYQGYNQITPLFRDLAFTQATGRHIFGDPDKASPILEWAYSNSRAIEDRPHSRTLINYVADYTDPRIDTVFGDVFNPSLGIVATSTDIPSATQGTPTLESFRESLKTDEEATSMRADLTIPIFKDQDSGDFWNFKLGYNEFDREREVRGRFFAYQYPLRFNLNLYSNAGQPGIEYLENWDSVSDLDGESKFNGWTGQGGRTRSDRLILSEFTKTGRTIRNVDAFSEVQASYLMSSAQFSGWNLMAGARLEDEKRGYEILADLNANTGSSVIGQRITQENTNVLPAVSMSRRFGWDDEFGLSLGWSRSIARPTFYEFAPVFTQDQATGEEVEGNPDLTNTQIDNFDLRVDWFDESGNSIALSLFHKSMESPIAQAYEIRRKTWLNGTQGFIQGVELEGRMQLNDYWSVTGNYTFIRSLLQYLQPLNQNVSQLIDSSFEGQPEHIFNLNLGYADPDTGFSSNLIYNFTGPFLVGVPLNNTVPAIVRDGYRSLDLVVQYPVRFFESGGIVKLKFLNLLDETDRSYFQGTDLTYQSFNPGRAVSLSYEVQF